MSRLASILTKPRRTTARLAGNLYHRGESANPKEFRERAAANAELKALGATR
jgi:hypothetical protein